jgi:agmatine/peptidylarginine deiminase
MSKTQQLLPEWAPQEAVLLAWPDQDTDWLPWLNDVQDVYLQIIAHLNRAGTGVLLLIRQQQQARCMTMLPADAKVLLLTADYNDTWVRDYGFLTCRDGLHNQPLDFVFNGWGQKFDARKDNLINQQVLSVLCQRPMQSVNLVLEGGALEIDQYGSLLSSQLCLTNHKRNGPLSLTDYRQYFSQYLGASDTVILSQGHLEGDDTDGHIDTLVRFTPERGLVLQSAFNRLQDPHYKGLQAMQLECQQAFPEHQIFPLPLPHISNAQGHRLPASYANYLISNEQILCPVYQQLEDQQALNVIAQAYPNHQVVGVNCLPLVQQFGSLHCISMQIPLGTLKLEIMQQLVTGVSVYE